MKRVRSMRFFSWMYFILFILLIIILLWLFLIVFLEPFYEKQKTNNINSTAVTLITEHNRRSEEEYYDLVFDLAQKNDLCIKITNSRLQQIALADNMNGKSEFISSPFFTATVAMEILESEDKIVYQKKYNEELNQTTMLFGTIILDQKGYIEKYIFIDSYIEPVGSTANLIKIQMVYISAIIFAIGTIISFFMAQGMSSPITDITKAAEKLAGGNYNIKLKKYQYDEVEKLATTLTYAAKEISKVDTQQRDLIANVSHDLRTPLTMVKAYAEMIRDLSGDNPEKRAQHLNVIIDETDRLSLLVTDMLDLSKMESEGLKLNYSTFNITQKLSDIITRYHDFCEEKGYTINFMEDEGVEVACDVVKIEQVIYNLVNNAINYTGEDKQIYIKQVNFAGGVRIEVSDTGQGISEENLHLIFDKYYRAEKNKREIVGTGLGLSIVKAILKEHNFPFGVKSVIGKGTTFWFEIKER